MKKFYNIRVCGDYFLPTYFKMKFSLSRHERKVLRSIFGV